MHIVALVHTHIISTKSSKLSSWYIYKISFFFVCAHIIIKRITHRTEKIFCRSYSVLLLFFCIFFFILVSFLRCTRRQPLLLCHFIIVIVADCEPCDTVSLYAFYYFTVAVIVTRYARVVTRNYMHIIWASQWTKGNKWWRSDRVCVVGKESKKSKNMTLYSVCAWSSKINSLGFFFYS